MVMKLMVDLLVLEMSLIGPLVLLEIGSMLIVLMLKILVYLALKDLLVLLLSEDFRTLIKILVFKLVVSLSGLVMKKEEMLLGVHSSGQNYTQLQNLKQLLLLNLDTTFVMLQQIMNTKDLMEIGVFKLILSQLEIGTLLVLEVK
jgi:hypothetical protein